MNLNRNIASLLNYKLFGISAATLLWILSIFLCAFLGRWVLTLGKTYLTGHFAIAVYYVLLAGVVLVFSFFCRKFTFLKLASGILILLAGIASYYFLNIAEERIHLFQFGFLGALIARDFSIYPGKTQSFLAFAIGASVGVADEALQFFLPWRVCDPRDMLLDAIGILLGVLIFNSVSRKA